MLAEPAMRDWYAAGIAETWREPGHEAEIAESGTVTADLRAKPA
jgi:glutathione S-transferase